MKIFTRPAPGTLRLALLCALFLLGAWVVGARGELKPYSTQFIHATGTYAIGSRPLITGMDKGRGVEGVFWGFFDPGYLLSTHEKEEAMTPSQSQTLAAFRRGLKDLASSLAHIKPREEEKPTGKHGELQIVTDGFDSFLDSGEKSAAFEIAAVLKLYRMMPEGKGAGC